MKHSAKFVSLMIPAFGLVSCGSVSSVGTNSVAFFQKTTSATTDKISQLTELAVNKVNPPTIKVVEAREKDLEKLPTGHEQALAFESRRKRSFWSFSGPVDFKEPLLPQDGGDLDGSLLPPKSP